MAEQPADDAVTDLVVGPIGVVKRLVAQEPSHLRPGQLAPATGNRNRTLRFLILVCRSDPGSVKERSGEAIVVQIEAMIEAEDRVERVGSHDGCRMQAAGP